VTHQRAIDQILTIWGVLQIVAEDTATLRMRFFCLFILVGLSQYLEIAIAVFEPGCSKSLIHGPSMPLPCAPRPTRQIGARVGD
jgi:hypothetical protein